MSAVFGSHGPPPPPRTGPARLLRLLRQELGGGSFGPRAEGLKLALNSPVKAPRGAESCRTARPFCPATMSWRPFKSLGRGIPTGVVPRAVGGGGKKGGDFRTEQSTPSRPSPGCCPGRPWAAGSPAMAGTARMYSFRRLFPCICEEKDDVHRSGEWLLPPCWRPREGRGRKPEKSARAARADCEPAPPRPALSPSKTCPTLTAGVERADDMGRRGEAREP